MRRSEEFHDTNYCQDSEEPIRNALGSLCLTPVKASTESTTALENLQEFIAVKEQLFVVNMKTNNHASSSHNGQRKQDSSNFSNNPYRLPGSLHTQKRPYHTMYNPEPTEVIGLSILNSMNDNETKPFAGFSQPIQSKKTVFGSQGNSPSHLCQPTLTGTAFLITGSNQVRGVREPPSLIAGSSAFNEPALLPVVLTGPDHAIHESSVTPSPIRLSEEYTYVVSRPTFPKVTHNFGDFVVGCDHYPCKFLDCPVGKARERQVWQRHQHQVVNNNFPNSSSSSPFNQFLRICFTCKGKLNQGKDIYIYRGESSFCSEECRSKGIMAQKMAKITKKALKRAPPPQSRMGLSSSCPV